MVVGGNLESVISSLVPSNLKGMNSAGDLEGNLEMGVSFKTSMPGFLPLVEMTISDYWYEKTVDLYLFQFCHFECL